MTAARPRLDLPPPVPAVPGQLPLHPEPAAVPCGEWPAPRRLQRPTVTVPGPDTWQPEHHEEKP